MYEEFLNFLADAVKTLNEFEKRHEEDDGDMVPYLGQVEVRYCGELIGHLVDEIGGAWSYQEVSK